MAQARPCGLSLTHSVKRRPPGCSLIASCKVCVADRDVYVSVTGAAQGDRPTWVASLELLSTFPPALHLPRARARQEMVAGETILSEEPAAQLAPACGAMY